MTAQKFRKDGLVWKESDSADSLFIADKRPSLNEFVDQIEKIYGQILKEPAREVAKDFWVNWGGFMKLIENNGLELGVDSLFLGRLIPKYKKYQVWRGSGQILILLGAITLWFNSFIGSALIGIGFCVYMIGQHYIRFRDSKQFSEEVLAFAKSDPINSGFAELCGFYISGIVQYKTSESKVSWPQKPSLILVSRKGDKSEQKNYETKNPLPNIEDKKKNLLEMIKERLDLGDRISGGDGSSIDKPIVIHHTCRHDSNYVGLEHTIIRCIGEIKRFSWKVTGQALLPHKGRSIDRIDLIIVSNSGMQQDARIESIYFDITEGYEYKAEVRRSGEQINLLQRKLVDQLRELEKKDNFISKHLNYLRDGKERAGLSGEFLDHLTNSAAFHQKFTEYFEKGGKCMMDFLRDNFFQPDKILISSSNEILMAMIIKELRKMEENSPHLAEHFEMFRRGTLWDDDKKNDFIFATFDTQIYEVIKVLEERTGKYHEDIFRELASRV